MAYQQLKEEEPPTGAAGLLAYLNADENITLDGLQAALRADPAGAKARVGRLPPSVTQPGFEGDAPVTVLCRRLANAQQYPVDVSSTPAMFRLLLEADPPSLIATGKKWYRGVVHAVDKSGHHAAGRKDLLFYDLKTQLGGFQDVLIRAVPAEFVRLEDAEAPPGAKIGAGAKVEVAPPRAAQCRARTALHLLCSADETLPPPVFLECLEVCLSTAEARGVALDAFAGDQPDALPRFVTTDPPLVNLTETQNLMKEAPFLRLLAAIPAAARVTDSGGWSIAHTRA